MKTEEADSAAADPGGVQVVITDYHLEYERLVAERDAAIERARAAEAGIQS